MNARMISNATSIGLILLASCLCSIVPIVQSRPNRQALLKRVPQKILHPRRAVDVVRSVDALARMIVRYELVLLRFLQSSDMLTQNLFHVLLSPKGFCWCENGRVRWR